MIVDQLERAKALVNGKAWPYEIYLDTNQDFKEHLEHHLSHKLS